MRTKSLHHERGISMVGSILWGLLLIIAAWFVFTVARKAYLDHEVRELCAKDGGVKVYETVRLPPEKFNEYGQINFYRPVQGENTLGSEYFFKQETTDYIKGNPAMFRWHVEVIRRTDNKLLGEVTSYARGGGDFPSPSHDSSFHCPENETDALDLFKKLFVPANKGDLK